MGITTQIWSSHKLCYNLVLYARKSLSLTMQLESSSTVWKNYIESKISSREQDIEFWAHEKIKHCWDKVKHPKNGFFQDFDRFRR